MEMFNSMNRPEGGGMVWDGKTDSSPVIKIVDRKKNIFKLPQG